MFVRNIKLNHKLVRKTYKTCWNTIELIFLKVLILTNVNKHLENVVYVNSIIINNNGNHYRVNFAFMSKKDAYNFIKNAVIMGEKGTL